MAKYAAELWNGKWELNPTILGLHKLPQSNQVNHNGPLDRVYLLIEELNNKGDSYIKENKGLLWGPNGLIYLRKIDMGEMDIGWSDGAPEERGVKNSISLRYMFAHVKFASQKKIEEIVDEYQKKYCGAIIKPCVDRITHCLIAYSITEKEFLLNTLLREFSEAPIIKG